MYINNNSHLNVQIYFNCLCLYIIYYISIQSFWSLYMVYIYIYIYKCSTVASIKIDIPAAGSCYSSGDMFLIIIIIIYILIIIIITFLFYCIGNIPSTFITI